MAGLEKALRTSAEELTRRRDDSESSWAEALQRLTAVAAISVPGAAYVGMTIRADDGRLASRAPSHTEITELDRTQAELGEGPCVDALQPGGSTVIEVDDFGVDPRWPRFSRYATDAGIGSLLSYAMAPLGAPPGAVNFYGRHPHAFEDPSSRVVAAAFAAQAAVATYGRERVAHLNVALSSRDVIGQAKGILMERFTLDDQQAFDLLVRSSQDTNLKLADVAHWLSDENVRRAHARSE